MNNLSAELINKTTTSLSLKVKKGETGKYLIVQLLRRVASSLNWHLDCANLNAHWAKLRIDVDRKSVNLIILIGMES